MGLLLVCFLTPYLASYTNIQVTKYYLQGLGSTLIASKTHVEGARMDLEAPKGIKLCFKARDAVIVRYVGQYRLFILRNVCKQLKDKCPGINASKSLC